jgi:hypothetical protein
MKVGPSGPSQSFPSQPSLVDQARQLRVEILNLSHQIQADHPMSEENVRSFGSIILNLNKLTCGD